MTTIKITELTNIGANLNGNTLVPVVNMNGTPVTQRSNVENLANYVLNTGTGANLGAVGNITITGGTDGYVLQTDGTGNLSWVAQSGGGNGTPGGANTQIQFNDAGSFGGDSGLTFNKTTNDLTVAGNIISTDGNVTANWVIGDYVSGNATPLHHIPGANVTGAVSFATTANAVAAANVSGLGNIATVNLDGNSSNILYGNGVFDSIPNPFNQDLNTTDNVTFANITSTDAIRFSNSSNIVGALGYASNYVSIEGYGSNSVNITANDVYTWTFDGNGNLTVPNGGNINFVNTGGITQAVNEDLRFTVSDDEQDGWSIESIVNDGAGNNLTQMQVRYDGVRINTDLPTNNYSWDFRDTGEFDVPKSIRGPVGGNLVISIGDQSGSNTFIDLQTRSYVGDALISNIHIANPDVTISTSSGAYNWAFGGDGLLTLPDGAIIDTTGNNFEVRAVENVNLEANSVVNIYTDGSGNAYQWQFGDDGNLTIPGSLIATTASPSPTINGFSFTNATDYSGSGNISTGNLTTTGMITTGGYLIPSINSSLSANGTIQGEATLLSKTYNVVTSSTVSPIKGVILPYNPVVGTIIYVAPRANTGSIKIYPQSGGTIEYGTINDPIQTVANQPGNIITFIATSSTNWITG